MVTIGSVQTMESVWVKYMGRLGNKREETTGGGVRMDLLHVAAERTCIRETQHQWALISHLLMDPV